MVKRQNEDDIAALDAALKATPGDASLLVKRGMLKWKSGDRGGAMTDYTAASMIDPEGPATELLNHSREILDFYCKDLYNP